MGPSLGIVTLQMSQSTEIFQDMDLVLSIPLLSDSCGSSLQELSCQRIPAPTEEKWRKQVASPDQFSILFYIPGLIERGENHCTLSLQSRGICVMCFDKANSILDESDA